MTGLDHAFFGADPRDPNFDIDQARAAYRYLRDGGPEAELVFKCAVFDDIQRELAVIKPEVQGLVDEWASERISKMVGRLERAGGRTATIISKALVPVAKAIAEDAVDEYSEQERSANAKRQSRDRRGRFVTMGRRIDYTVPKMPHAEANALGIPMLADEAGKHLPDATQYAFRAAKQQTADMLRGAHETGALHEVRAAYHKPGGHDENGVYSPEANELQTYRGGVDWDDLANMHANGYKLMGVQADIDRDLNVGGAAFDLITAAGVSPETAGSLVGGAKANDWADFQSKWKTQGQANTPRARSYARVEAGAQVANAMLPAHTPAPVRTGVIAAGWAGRHGQKLEDLLGPTAAKNAYRYRAVEKKPSPQLQRQLNFLRRNIKSEHGGANSKAARDQFVIGSPIKGGTVPLPGGKKTEGSPVRDYLEARLPDPNRVQLHLESGRGVPSQGILVNERGQIVAESVGLGEDHYLPFTPRALKQLKGGEYARTRAFGGPTTEDFYAALVGGARAFTVVSNSGTFVVQFQPDFRGARRFNDKAARMLGTYAGLLDALQAEIVGFEIPEDRSRELRARAARDFPGSPMMRDQRFHELEAAELDDPQLSQAAKSKIFEETMAVLAQKQNGGEGLPVDEFILQRKAESHLSDERLADLERDMGSKDPDVGDRARNEMLTAIGSSEARRVFSQLVEAAENQRLQETRKMRLDGAGYQQALLAMHEQFPYYLEKPIWIRKEDKPGETGGGPKKDLQYTRPGDVRPHKARIGFHNAPNAAVGSGKKSASTLYGGADQDVATTDKRNPREALKAEKAATAERAAAATGGTQGSDVKRPDPGVRKENMARLGDELAGKIQAAANAGTLYAANGTPATREYVDAVLTQLRSPRGKDGLEMPGLGKELTDEGVQWLREALPKAFPNIDQHPEIANHLEQLTMAAGGKRALPADGMAHAQSLARTAVARGGVTPEDLTKLKTLKIDFGPHYEFGQSPDVYVAELQAQTARAQQLGLDVPPLTSTDFPAEIDRILEPEFAALGQSGSDPSTQQKVETLMRLRLLGRLFDGAQKPASATQAAQTVPEATQGGGEAPAALPAPAGGPYTGPAKEAAEAPPQIGANGESPDQAVARMLAAGQDDLVKELMARGAPGADPKTKELWKNAAYQALKAQAEAQARSTAQ